MVKIISNSVLNIINNNQKNSYYNNINIFDQTKIIDYSKNNFLEINIKKKQKNTEKLSYNKKYFFDDYTIINTNNYNYPHNEKISTKINIIDLEPTFHSCTDLNLNKDKLFNKKFLAIFLLLFTGKYIILKNQYKKYLDYQLNKEYYISIFNLLQDSILNKYKLDNPIDIPVEDVIDTTKNTLAIDVKVDLSFASIIYKIRYPDHETFNEEILRAIYFELYPEPENPEPENICGC